jgi:hypothetical protein
MRKLFDDLYAPDRYYRLAADDIRQSITRQVARARSESERGLRPPGDPWAALDLIDVAGIPDVGILVFFRLPQSGSRINVYVADVRSRADLERARSIIEAGGDASAALGEGYDVFDDHFIFSFPEFASHVSDVTPVARTQFFAISAPATGAEETPGSGTGPGDAGAR